MKKYSYIRLSKTKKLRYMGNFFKKKLYIIFLPGFMSNIEGEKPKAFKSYAVRKKVCSSIYFVLLFACGVVEPIVTITGTIGLGPK